MNKRKRKREGIQCTYTASGNVRGHIKDRNSITTNCMSNDAVVTFVMLKYENLVKLAKNVAIVKSVDATKNPQKLATAVKFLLAAGFVASIAHPTHVKTALARAFRTAKSAATNPINYGSNPKAGMVAGRDGSRQNVTADSRRGGSGGAHVSAWLSDGVSPQLPRDEVDNVTRVGGRS